MRAILTELHAEACIDPKRVYASGCSNGGGMSYKPACEAADVVTGVAPVAFDCVDGAQCGDCAPSRPITVVQFRVDYEGDGAFVGAQANFAHQGESNMCTDTPGPLSEQPACVAFSTCGDETQTTLCTVQNGRIAEATPRS